MNEQKISAGIIGATGMVGQRFVSLLSDHPYFEISALAASPRSAGKKFSEAVGGRWKLSEPMPNSVADMKVLDAGDIEAISGMCDFVFCAVDMPKAETQKLEEAYAKAETPVVSNNSACRNYPDVPMLIAEINSSHLAVIETQKKRLGTKTGFIAVKPNCSIQSYVPMLTPLIGLGLREVAVTTYQAISGAGKTFLDWPEMCDNVIPYIGGEEEKSEKEPMKVWGTVKGGQIENAQNPKITAQCIRVPVTDGHLAAVFVKFGEGSALPSKEEIIALWKGYAGEPQILDLPSAPKQFIHYFDEDNRPQTGLDRDLERGMAISAGRLREDESKMFDYKFIGLSHNTLRGAAGGGVLSAELLYKKGFIAKK